MNKIPSDNHQIVTRENIFHLVHTRTKVEQTIKSNSTIICASQTKKQHNCKVACVFLYMKHTEKAKQTQCRPIKFEIERRV